MPLTQPSKTGRPVRRWCAVAVAAVVAPLLTVVGSTPNAAADPGPAPGAAAAPADAGTSSTLAPVRLPGEQRARTYTPAQLRAFERTGGDPAVLAYWTPERMAKATPLDAPDDAKVVERTARALAKQAPKSVRPVPSSLGSRMKNYPPPVTNFSVTNGKLFIGGYESGSWCSASAVNTPSRRVLITAGHCVHSGAGGTWQNNLVFVPGYNAFNADRDPVGRFQAYQLRTFNAWIDDSDLGRDVGYVTTFSGGDWGATVVDTVGGHGLAWNGGTEFDTSIFGYPSNRDGGDQMWACWGVATDNSWWDNRSRIGCGFGPGSSGGPWLWQYDNGTGQGYVRSVMSTVDGAGVNRGPYFDTAVSDGLNAADGDW
ncbi:MAG: trypsin-like serine peptidase [Phycicoccus sp.]